MTDINKPAHNPSATVKLNDSREILLVAGELSFKNVVKLRNQGKQCLGQTTPATVIVDLQAVESSDNSGLVLLVTWMHDARDLQKNLAFRHIPAFLEQMAQVFGLHSLIHTGKDDG